jgi:V8-like Glu-specific endopeptidase
MKRSAWAAGMTAALALSLASAAGASAAAVATHDAAQSPAEVSDYWTAERMREAQPLDRPVGGERGPLAETAAAPPDQEIDPALDTTYPYRIHGKLFLTIAGSDASCSATVVTSFSRDLVLTAGHCVGEPAGGGQVRWAENVVFVPAYRNGSAPFGAYPAVTSGAPVLWLSRGVISFDVGVVKLAPSGGVPIQEALGSRGIAFNRAPRSFRGKRFQLFGYPASPPQFYDGERPILCDSPALGIETFSGALVAGPCHQQEGASGGGWVLGGTTVVSLTSHGACRVPSTQCDVISGTYLGNAALKLWAAAGGGLPKGLKKKIKGCKRLRGKKQKRCLSRYETFRPVVR